MISLVINSKCNQKCEYCFAYNTLHDNNTFMSLETCEEVLKFQAKAIDYRIKHAIGIIGGEPTLHHQFSEMLALINDYSKRYYFDPILFTNGTHLCDHEIPEGMNLTGLINVNHPDIVGEKNFNGTLKAIEKYCEDFNIGINLYPGMKDYSFIFDIAKEYDYDEIRFSVSCPDGKFTHLQNDRKGYFESMVPLFMDFCEEATRRNIMLSADCCIIPYCYFTKKQQDIIDKICYFYPNISEYSPNTCIEHIDIHPDLSFTHCFIRPETKYITEFERPDDLLRYMLINWISPAKEGMKYDRCTNCSTMKAGQCNGGCLRFSKKELNNG